MPTKGAAPQVSYFQGPKAPPAASLVQAQGVAPNFNVRPPDELRPGKGMAALAPLGGIVGGIVGNRLSKVRNPYAKELGGEKRITRESRTLLRDYMESGKQAAPWQEAEMALDEGSVVSVTPDTRNLPADYPARLPKEAVDDYADFSRSPWRQTEEARRAFDEGAPPIPGVEYNEGVTLQPYRGSSQYLPVLASESAALPNRLNLADERQAGAGSSAFPPIPQEPPGGMGRLTASGDVMASSGEFIGQPGDWRPPRRRRAGVQNSPGLARAVRDLRDESGPVVDLSAIADRAAEQAGEQARDEATAYEYGSAALFGNTSRNGNRQ